MYLVLIVLSIAAFSCKNEKYENVTCDNAQLNLCNRTRDELVVYGWGTNYVTDTLFPGECKLKDFGRVVVKYDFWGNETERQSSVASLYTPSGYVSIELLECYSEFQPYTSKNIAHCYNGVFDVKERENDVDCGTYCQPCDSMSIDCENLTRNRFKFDGQTSSYYLSSFWDHNSYDDKRTLEFTFSNGEILYVSLSFDEDPFFSRRFIVGDDYFHTAVWFTDRNGFNRHNAENGQSIYYIIDENNKKSIQFCDVNFKRLNGTTIKAQGSLTID